MNILQAVSSQHLNASTKIWKLILKQGIIKLLKKYTKLPTKKYGTKLQVYKQIIYLQTNLIIKFQHAKFNSVQLPISNWSIFIVLINFCKFL